MNPVEPAADQTLPDVDAGEIARDPILGAVFDRAETTEAGLIARLSSLLDAGANPSTLTRYGESALRVLSHVGYYDAVRLLLDRGAPEDQLAWTPLIRAVAIGTLEDVAQLLDRGADLEGGDYWSRTAWHVALMTGALDKASLLRERGANVNARGRCGQVSLTYATQSERVDVLQFALDCGLAVDATDDSGTTPLQDAVAAGLPDLVRFLLEAGADPNHDSPTGGALECATNRDIVRLLLDAGADPGRLRDAGRRTLKGLPPEADVSLLTASLEEFRRARTRRFGRSNPERFHEPFWLAMIRAGVSGYEAATAYGEPVGDRGRPVWCAMRFGQSVTPLPDGRVVCVAGEHEDHYDPDFCIYNDVFVHHPDGRVENLGYPAEVFPPTDFHTATLVGRALYLIGSLGYSGARRYGETPVRRLDLDTFEFETLATTGSGPGWIHRHRATLIEPRSIRITGGAVAFEAEGAEQFESNGDAFVLDLGTLAWTHHQGLSR